MGFCSNKAASLPSIIDGAAHARGCGREVIAVAKFADMVLMVLDASREADNRHGEILKNELETIELRLNRDICFRRKMVVVSLFTVLFA